MTTAEETNRQTNSANFILVQQFRKRQKSITITLSQDKWRYYFLVQYLYATICTFAHKNLHHKKLAFTLSAK